MKTITKIVINIKQIINNTNADDNIFKMLKTNKQQR